MREIIDSRFRDAIPDHWPSLCSVASKEYTVSSANEKVWDQVSASAAKFMDVEARIAPIFRSRAENEVRRTDKTRTVHHDAEVIVNTYYPAILPESDYAIVDGVPYFIRGVESDSQHFYTRLRVEIIDWEGQTVNLMGISTFTNGPVAEPVVFVGVNGTLSLSATADSNIKLYRGGVRLRQTVDYTVINHKNLVLRVAAAANEYFEAEYS